MNQAHALKVDFHVIFHRWLGSPHYDRPGIYKGGGPGAFQFPGKVSWASLRRTGNRFIASEGNLRGISVSRCRQEAIEPTTYGIQRLTRSSNYTCGVSGDVLAGRSIARDVQLHTSEIH